MNAEATLNDLGIDAITGIELTEALGLSFDELQFPQRFQKLKSVIGFLKDYPEDTRRFFISKTTKGKSVDKLDFMFEYVHLLRRKQELEKGIEEAEKEKSALELSNEPTLLREVEERHLGLQTDYGLIRDELAIYEK